MKCANCLAYRLVRSRHLVTDRGVVNSTRPTPSVSIAPSTPRGRCVMTPVMDKAVEEQRLPTTCSGHRVRAEQGPSPHSVPTPPQ